MSSNPILEQFEKVTVEDVLADKKNNDIISLKNTDSVETAIKTLSENRFVAAPVFNEKKDFVGFVDMVALLNAIAQSLPAQSSSIKQDELKSLKVAGSNISVVPIHQAVAFPERDVLTGIQMNDKASKLLKIFSQGHHRVAVFNKDKLIAIATESDAVRYLSKQLDKDKLKEVGEKSLSDLGCCSNEVVTIPKTATVLDAIRKMSEKKTQQLAVVDEEERGGNRLAGNFSASDVKGLYHKDFSRLLETLPRYLCEHSLKPVCVLPKTKLIDAVKEFADTKFHHLWVIEDFKPVGVVTLASTINVANKQ